MLFRLAIVLLSFFLCGPSFAERKVALLIGNSAYSGGAAVLKNPSNDIDMLKTVLQRAAFEVYDFKDLSRSAMSDALSEFEEKAAGADIGLVFYSGHGLELNGTNYLLPVDATLASDRDVKYEALELDDVLQSLSKVVKLKLVLLDACRDNPFLAKMKRVATRGVATRGLARLDDISTDSNLLVGYATAPGQVAFDGAGTNSPYTIALARHLVEPGIEVETALRAVAKDVYQSTGGKQRPYKTGSILDTVMLDDSLPSSSSPIQSDPCRDAQAHWNAVRDGHDVKLLDEHLALFGTCAFANLAKQRLSQIRGRGNAPLATQCDLLVADTTDTMRLATIGGVEFGQIRMPEAKVACETAVKEFPDVARMQFQYGRALSKTKDFTVAMEWYRKAAEAEYPAAMRMVAILFRDGSGVEQDYSQAMTWFGKAADRGDFEAMKGIGDLFQKGLGVPVDLTAATTWYRKSADAGSASAMLEVATMNQEGKGLPRNMSEALNWYQKAADLNNVSAMTSLAFLYQTGEGVPQDYAQAAKWFQKASIKGDPMAMAYMGLLTANGLGTERDPKEAARLVEAALRKGNTYAQYQMKQRSGGWPDDFRRELQQRLRDARVFPGKANGKFGPSTFSAIDTIFGKSVKN
ncbi:caspase family protein [Pararhizobium sp. DWP3-4]|uniref:caspase family protein n=1 Tax=Pararhizobium sp. DWP3-4 TaxID=2804565 RepID=UPI003CF91B26